MSTLSIHSPAVASPQVVASGANLSIPLPPFNHTPWYCPRFWCGMQPKAWWQLLADHDFRFSRWGMVGGVSAISVMAQGFDGLQSALYRQKSVAAPLVQDPIFVIGHWRCGTTLLHQLMMADKRFACPNVFQCFAPKSFLVCEPWLKPLMRKMLPDRRPMDNVRLGWDEPMEDEFALLVMGCPTPYRRIAFPNLPTRDLAAINFGGLSADQIRRWRAGMLEFVQYLNLHYQRPLVLKSPPHTARVSTLLSLFPKAKFVHVTRDPYKFIPSTVHLWAALDQHNALHKPHHRGLLDFVFDAYEQIYEGFQRDRHLLNDSNFVQIRFEDLVRDKEQVMRQTYDQLQIDGFDQFAQAQIREEHRKAQGYRCNGHALSPELAEEIDGRCGNYREQFGYQRSSFRRVA